MRKVARQRLRFFNRSGGSGEASVNENGQLCLGKKVDLEDCQVLQRTVKVDTRASRESLLMRRQ